MKLFLGVFLILCVIGFGVFFLTQSISGQKEVGDEPTVVQKGKITDKERPLSKEYKKLYNFRDGKKLTELKEPDGIGIFIGPGETANSSTATITTANKFLEKLSCEADAVLVGTIKNKTSHLSDDETFVFTTYDFDVKEIIKDNSESRIEINKTIPVTRPGGFIKINEQVIKFDDASYEPLKLNKEYLLFLKFVPEANGYVVSSPEGDFVLEKNTFKSISKRRFHNELRDRTDSKSLLSMIHNAGSTNCNQYLSGERKEND